MVDVITVASNCAYAVPPGDPSLQADTGLARILPVDNELVSVCKTAIVQARGPNVNQTGVDNMCVSLAAAAVQCGDDDRDVWCVQMRMGARQRLVQERLRARGQLSAAEGLRRQVPQQQERYQAVVRKRPVLALCLT